MNFRLLIIFSLLTSCLSAHSQPSQVEGFIVDTSGQSSAWKGAAFFERDSIDWWYFARKSPPEFSSTSIDLSDKQTIVSIERSRPFNPPLKENETGISGSACIVLPIDLKYAYFGKRAIVAIEEKNTMYDFRFRVKRTSSGELWIRRVRRGGQ